MSKTLASYLADLSPDELQEMLSGIQQKRDRLQQENKELAFEESLVEKALTRKARRTGSGSGGARVSREQVFQIVSSNVARRFKAPDAMAAMKAEGIEMAAESLRQHLRRLVKDERFGREEDFYINFSAPEQPPGASNGNGQATQASPGANGIAPGGEREIGIQHGSPQGAG